MSKIIHNNKNRYDNTYSPYRYIEPLPKCKISDSIEPFTICIRNSIVQQIFITSETAIKSEEKYPYPTLILTPVKISPNKAKETFFSISHAYETTKIDVNRRKKTVEGYEVFCESWLHPYWYQFFPSRAFYTGEQLVSLDYLLNMPEPTDFVCNQRIAFSEKLGTIYHIQYLIFAFRNNARKDFLPFCNNPLSLKQQSTDLKNLIEQNIDIAPDNVPIVALLLDETPIDTTEIMNENHSELFYNGISLPLKTSNFAHFSFILLAQNKNNPITIEELARKYGIARDNQAKIKNFEKKYNDTRTDFNKGLKEKLNMDFDVLVIDKTKKGATIKFARINPYFYNNLIIKTIDTNLHQ